MNSFDSENLIINSETSTKSAEASDAKTGQIQFDVLTLFPEIISNYVNSSMMKKAQDRDLISCKIHDIRKFAIDEYGHVDDTLYGGGRGMLMRAEPLYQALKSAKDSSRSKRLNIFLSPKGKVFDQDMAKEFSTYDQIILICGHYEGVDQRFIDECVDLEVSIGDFVISGGELGALTIIDASSRMLTGFLADAEAMQDESHYHGLLESRQYTKPRSWLNREVPEVLFSGNHKLIAEFKYYDALNETLTKRPDLFQKLDLSDEDLEGLANFRKNNNIE